MYIVAQVLFWVGLLLTAIWTICDIHDHGKRPPTNLALPAIILLASAVAKFLSM